jgi:ketosteroid isomerase-like protein
VADDSKIDELVAYEEIRRLAADYAHGVDKQDFERFMSVWTQGASWQPMPDGDWSRGNDAIAATIKGIWDTVAETHHWTANHSIRITGDTATGLADADCVSQTPDGQWFRVAATYVDTYERQGGTWGIKERTTQIHHYLPIAQP